MTRLTGGQALARALRAEGIDVVFGIVGTHNVDLFDGLYEVDGLRVITARHESGAGFMADGFSRASGRIAACLVVPGPGVTNLMTAMGQAYLDSVPMLAIAGQNPSDRADRHLEEFHELHGSVDVAGSVAMRSTRLARPAEAPGVIREAVELMRSGRPRPVFIEVPLDVAAASEDVSELSPREGGFARAEIDAQAIHRAAHLLAEARKPLVVAGGGVISAEASGVLLEIARRLGAPVITTVHGRGAVPDDDPLALGDGWSRLDFFDPLLAEADVCLAVGTSFGTVNDASRGGKLPQTLVQIDVDPTAIGRHRPATVGIVADARRALERLLRALDTSSPREVWCDVPHWREVKRAAIGGVVAPVLEILDDLRAALPRDAIVADDLCVAGYWAPLALDVFEARTLLHPGMWGTLGYALPAAIGAQIGRPDRVAVALSGDGGFLYSSQELSTAISQGVNVVAIVFNDNAFGALRSFQDRLYGGRRIGVALSNPDFAKLGAAYGAHGVKLRGPKELGAAVRQAVERGGLSVIECPIDFDAPPPWMP